MYISQIKMYKSDMDENFGVLCSELSVWVFKVSGSSLNSLRLGFNEAYSC
jgi:hypothetical protein